MAKGRVVVVDDEASEREALVTLVRHWGYEVRGAATAKEALELVEADHPSVVLSDLMLPEMDGMGLLQTLRGAGLAPAVLLVTGHGSIESAVEAMREGAFDYLTKPIDPVRLEVLLQKAAEQETLTREVHQLRRQLRQTGGFGSLLGRSKAMQGTHRWIELSATSMAPVFIHGESGTGKELVARTIHELSSRRDHPLVALNCAAIPEHLIESELFGHERGAFTGATERRAGCFELADRGTLFLDEIAEMEVSTQAKLLRVLQESTFRRVGGRTEIKVDVRVIAATNRAPEAAMAAKQLREDLFYRLNVFTIPLPPLRERHEDIGLLAQAFIEEFNAEDERTVKGLDAEAQTALERHPWPGNVRELRNVVQRAVAVAGHGLIGLVHLGPGLGGGSSPAGGGAMSFDDLERTLIRRALDEARGDQRQAAARLGLTMAALNKKLAHHK